MARMSPLELPVDAGDFRLMDRRALDALLAMPERNRFLRGMSVWVGFNQTAVTYQREAAQRGRDQVHAGPDAALLARRDRRASRTRRCSSRPCSGFAISAIAFLAIPLVVVARFTDIFVRRHLVDAHRGPAARRHPADHGRA